MSGKDDGGPAFPAMDFEKIGEVSAGKTFGGMSLRDWFAGQALSGLNTRQTDERIIARYAYEQADAMLAQRAK